MVAIIRTFCHCAIIAMVVSLAPFASGQTTILRVDGDDGSPTPVGQGSDWGDDAYKYLADGLKRASFLIEENLATNVQVWVRGAPDPGLTYKPNEGDGLDPDDQDLSFELRENVSIYGGFDTGDDELSDADPANNVTILSGDLDDDDGSNFANRSNNAYHVVHGASLSLDADDVLDGFTIRGGFGGEDAGEDPEREGGGLYLKNAGTPRIANCIFKDNTARKGGGMYVETSTPTIRSCNFEGNLGGPSIENVLFNGAGGGLYIKHCSPIVVDCRFIDNVAGQTHPSGLNAGIGGGIQVIDDAAPRIFNCEFIRNRCGHVGGGINIRESDTDLETLVVNCIFVANYARDSGGGCRVGLEGRSRFVQCTFVENYCSDDGDITHQGCGGGMSIGRGQDLTVRTAYIDNCIFWNNRIYDPQAHGSQIALVGEFSGTATLKHCDVQDSGSSGDGLYEQDGSSF